LELESDQKRWKTEREKEEEEKNHRKSDPREESSALFRSLTLSRSLPLSLFLFPFFSSTPFHSYQASRDDLAVFASLPSAPDAKAYPAAARWFSHIKALLGASFPGAGKGVSVAGGAAAAAGGAAPAAAAAAPAAKAAAAAGSDSDSDDDDDELDLFGEMTPEELAAAEAKKKVIEEAKRRGAEKAKLTKSMIVLDVKPWDDETDLAAMEAEVSLFQLFGERRGKEEREKRRKKKLTRKEKNFGEKNGKNETFRSAPSSRRACSGARPSSCRSGTASKRCRSRPSSRTPRSSQWTRSSKVRRRRGSFLDFFHFFFRSRRKAYKNSPLFPLPSFFLLPKLSYQPTEELVRDGESDNIQSIDVVSFNKL